MTSSTFNVQRSRHRAILNSGSTASPLALRLTPRGFTYLALLAAIAIMGILLGAAGKYWSAVMMREKEEELLFRGDQYRTAIERYYFALPGKQVFPQNIEDLLRDNRTAIGKRHLRKQFKDPMTGEDFVLIRDKDKGNRIVGVQSASTKKPIKQANFPDQYASFANAESYDAWKFVFLPPQQPGQQRTAGGGAGARTGISNLPPGGH